ncbi:MAG: GntR family transcriptional regulator, partial [Corynebacterium urealyticum]
AEPEFHAPFVAKNREIMDALERMDFDEAADILEDSLISTPTAVQKYLSH